MMQAMRTTVTLDPDVEALVRRRMSERGLSFKAALNEAIRDGLASTRSVDERRTPTFRMGHEPRIPWDKALRLAVSIEDEELIRRLTNGT
jgi:hypothetical protein